MWTTLSAMNILQGDADTAIALTHPAGRRSIKPLREK